VQRIISDYVLMEQLGSSGLATVYRAQDARHNREVALKVLRPFISTDEVLMERFSREMELIAGLRHPNILPVYAKESHGALHWIAMQYVSWPTLRQWLQHSIPMGMAMTILKQVADAVETAHEQGIDHGDIKPGNIFLDPETGQVLLGDFGMVLLREGTSPTMRISLKTPLPTYTAPERAQGSSPNLRSNVYSLAVLLFDMLTGTAPFNGLDPATVLAKQMSSSPPLPSRINPDIPQRLDAILVKALSPHQERRYETPRDFLRALEAEAPVTYSSWVPFAVMGGMDAIPSFPGMEHVDGALQLEEGLTGVICTICGNNNLVNKAHCAVCWSELSRVSASPGIRVFTMEERLKRWRRGTLLRRAVLATALVVLGGYITVRVLDISPTLPTPTSDISSASAHGEWAMINRNLSGLGPVPGVDADFTGQEVWRFNNFASISSTPAVKDGKVYITTYDGRVVALDQTTGSQIWEYRGPGGIDSSPAVAGDLLFYGGRNSRVTALDADTGEKRWDFETGNPITGSPIVHDGVLYIGSGDRHIYALDALTGEKRWDDTTGNWIFNTPALAGDILVVGSMAGEVYIYDTDTGKKRFVSREFGGAIESSPVIVGDSIYVATRNGLVYSMNLREEEVPLSQKLHTLKLQLWVWNLLGYPGLPKGVEWSTYLGDAFYTTPAADEDTIYISGDGGRLYALDRLTGLRLWTFKSESDYFSAPTILDDVLLVGDGEGRLHAVDTGSGEEQWVLQIAEGRTSTPVVAGDVLYLASTDGTLYAVK
jgi:outer membrane protein assembly factor BamB/serine/threonine protein kinase